MLHEPQFLSGIGSKTAKHIDAMYEAASIRKMLDNDYPGLFADTQDSLNHTVDPRSVVLNHSLAQRAAIEEIAERILPVRENVQDDGIALMVAEKYKYYLENPDALQLHVASRAR